MGDNQEEEEVLVQSWKCDAIRITETWLDSSWEWSTAMEEYHLFRKDRRGKKVSCSVYKRDKPLSSEVQYKQDTGVLKASVSG